MNLSKTRQKTVLAVLVGLLLLLNLYFYLTGEKPKTAPLTFTRGTIASSPIRHGLTSRIAGPDPLNILFERREEKYPGVIRDMFRMENPVVKSKATPSIRIVTAPTPTVMISTAPTPSVPERTPEEIAEDLARADLSKFRFLGFLTEKDNTLFLSKEGELFMVKSGDRVLQNYRIKEAGKDYVILFDSITGVEVRVELSGSDLAPPASQPPQRRK